MRNNLTYCMASLTAGAMLFFSTSLVSARAYSEEEYKCVAIALWHEGGSSMNKVMLTNPSKARMELRLMAHTMKVRGLADNWYHRNDWGGPNLCNVIRQKGQYSYRRTTHKNEKPVEGNLWEKIVSIVTNPIRGIVPLALGGVTGKTAVIHEEIKERITTRRLWEESKNAARDVLDEKNPWQSPEQYRFADTYQMWCSAPEYYKDTCDKRIVSSPKSACWFKMEQVLLENGPLPEGRKHAFYRRLTLGEVTAALNAPPPHGCEDYPGMVRIVHEGWKTWIAVEAGLIPAPKIVMTGNKHKNKKKINSGHRGKKHTKKSKKQRRR